MADCSHEVSVDVFLPQCTDYKDVRVNELGRLWAIFHANKMFKFDISKLIGTNFMISIHLMLHD